MLRRGRWLVPPGALSLWALLLVLAAPAGADGPKCTILGTGGADTLHGKPGPDVICGLGGNDEIAGGGGADRLLAGPGNDVLAGGPGKDSLRGGGGQDQCRDAASSTFFSCERHPGRKLPRVDPPVPGVPRPPELVEPPDEEPPLLAFLSFGGRYVDNSVGDTEMSLLLEAWDWSGVGAVTIEIEGPEGFSRHLELEGEPEEWTSLETAVDIPGSAPAGDYRISSLTISDRKGNVLTRTAAELDEEFEVFHGPDEDWPELTGFSLSPTEVDTSGEPATIGITIEARDDVSGIKDAHAAVALPDWEPGPLVITGEGGGEIPPSSGTRHEGTWSETYPLVEGAMPGYYKIRAVYLTDMVGHSTYYSTKKLKELGFPAEFLQSGSGDTTPPEILDYWFEPSQLRTSAGERTILFYTHVRDDITGFGQAPYFGLSRVETDIEPAGKWTEFSYSGKVPVLVSGSEIDGVWREELSLEADAAPGEYVIPYIRATDRAGNELVLKRPEIEAEGWPASFVNEP